MIEWDEVNWRSGVGILVFAAIVIAGSVFAVNDYMTSKQMKSDLDGQLAAINDFYRTWKPPSAKEQEEMRNQADSLQKELAQLSPRIGLEIDPAKLEEKIRGLAAATGVSLEKMELQPQTADGFLKVYPMDFTVKGVPEQLSRFMIGIGNLEAASRRGGEPGHFRRTN